MIAAIVDLIAVIADLHVAIGARIAVIVATVAAIRR
jgi:hypothetical protein